MALILLTLCAGASASSIFSPSLKACASDHEDDLPHEACYGWCVATAATEHCGWCKCRGCNWCDAASSLSGSSASSSTAVAPAGVSGAVCSSDAEDDVSYADCQPFCTESEWRSHCGICKCKGCHFCSCSSTYDDDSTERQCQAWCSDEYYDDHCGRCKCQGCDFCAHGRPCTPAQSDDSSYEQCESFCAIEFSSTHCGLCKCKDCDFCKAPAESPVATCSSGVIGDVDREICEDFCDPANRADHCSMCKCRGCDFCACASTHENDAKVEMCAPWCNDNDYDTHCDWCSCKGCQFCRQGGKSCQSFFVTGDIDHESCEDFCSEDAANVHCSYCKCKNCGFCQAEEHKQKVAAAAALKQANGGHSAIAAIPEGAKACFTGLSHDSLYEMCEGFCDDSQRGEHCKLCKCRGCHMCSATCDSGLPGDMDVMSCASSCSAEVAAGVCPTCRCRSCSFCNVDGTPKDMSGETSGGPGLLAALDTSSEAGGACIPFNTKDVDKRACQAHCSESLKGVHCETCKCKDCGFCQGFHACSSGIAHDTKWEDCDATCTGRATCHLCKCRSCSDCAVSTDEACDSGILGDAPYLTCLPGVCNIAHKGAHCQLCGCRGCAFCDGFDEEEEVSPPPPRAVCVSNAPGDTHYAGCGPLCFPRLARTQCQMCKCSECSFCTDTAYPCDSVHVGDVPTGRCEPWCSSFGAAAHMCSFCSCRTCDFCMGVAQQPGIAHSDSSECSIGAELLIIDEKEYTRSHSYKYEARVRLGTWQAGAVVEVDFSDAHDEVEVNEDIIEDAILVSASETGVKVELSSYGDVLKGFTFQFTIRGATLALTESKPARVTCTNTQALLPSPPSPPPPPHRPFLRSPPPASEESKQQALLARLRDENKCVLGGRVKIASTWAGGTSLRGVVTLAAWRAGAEVTIDFNRALRRLADDDGDSMEELHASHALHATPISPSPVGTLRFQLGPHADNEDGFTFVAHGGPVGQHPALRCSLIGEKATDEVSSAGSTTTAVKAIIGPTCAPLGLSYSVLQKWQGGFKAAVAVRTWQAGAKVTLRYASKDVSLLDQWSATRSSAVEGGGDGYNAIALALGDGPDAEHHGFGFTARGSDGATETPRVTCALDTVALLLTPVSNVACGMGASYSVSPNVKGGTDSFLVRVRLSQWQAGGSVTVTFAASVESQAGGSAEEGESPAALEYTDALGTEHTFELGAHPDTSHGFSFVVRGGGALVQVQHLTCKPKGYSKATNEVEAVTTNGAPDAPTAVAAKALGCDSIQLDWQAAIDNGISITGYRVYYRRREAASDASFSTLEVSGGGSARRATLNGLSGGTTYYLKVRARNQVGEGKYSARAEAETPSGGAPKTAPSVMTPLSSPDCRTLRLALPSLRPGCHGESFLSLKMRSFGSGAGWSDALSMAAESEARVGDLDPWEVYELRAVPHNGKGVGPPSESTGPVMVGIDGSALAAPRVRAVGSASFSLSWADVSGPCRTLVRTRVSYRRMGAAGANASSWHEVTSDASGTSYLAYPLRCPAGCVFRVESGRGDGRWAAASASSVTVRSSALPVVADGSVRVELRLRNEQPDQDTMQMSLDAAADMANALRLDDGGESIIVREVYGAGRYIIADVSSAAQEGMGQRTSAALLVQQLALMAQEATGAGWGLRAGVATKEVDAISMLVEDGSVWTSIRAGNDARDRLDNLARWYGAGGGSATGDGGPLEQARRFVTLVVVCGMLWFCCGRSRASQYEVVDAREFA